MSNTSSRRRIEAVGWLFFSVTFVVLAGPGVYLIWSNVYASTEFGISLLFGLSLAGGTAAVLTFVVNSALQRRNRRELATQRKQQKKKSKKKK